MEGNKSSRGSDIRKKEGRTFQDEEIIQTKDIRDKNVYHIQSIDNVVRQWNRLGEYL